MELAYTTMIVFLIILFVGYLIGTFVANKRWQEQVPQIRGDAIKKSRSVLTGQFSEQLAPYLPGFKYKPTEARFIGKPIDFIIFSGLDEKDPQEIIFIEVKSGHAKTSPVENKLKKIIEEKKVRWEEYRVME